MDFAKRLKRLREDANLSQKELAEKIGITAQSYNNYEKRGYKPTPEMLVKLAIALKTTPNDLLEFEKTSISDIEYADKYLDCVFVHEDYVRYDMLLDDYDGECKFRVYKIPKDDFLEFVKYAREETENIIEIQNEVTRPALFESFWEGYVRNNLDDYEELE